jgi:hypothetical protein
MKFWILKNKYFFGILVFLILASCNNEDVAENNDDNLQSGVVITFDDDYVNEWFEANAILQAYDWKATFFVTRFHQLSSEKIQKLIELLRCPKYDRTYDLFQQDLATHLF